MKIVVLEKIEFTVKQKQTLDSLGSVVFYDSSNESECKERVRGADVVVIDWIDPNWFSFGNEKSVIVGIDVYRLFLD